MMRQKPVFDDPKGDSAREEKEVVAAYYAGDSKRFHRFLLNEKKGQGIAGAVYIARDRDVPKELVVILKVEGKN